MRALIWLTVLLGCAAACAEDPTPPATPSLDDAQVGPPVLDSGTGGALEDRITIPTDPRDAAITDRTPVLDLPLVVGRPEGPLSTASLDVRVSDAMGQPVRDLGVTTGGPAVFTNALGIAHVTAVYGAGSTDVFAFGAPYALTHAQVVIRDGEVSAVDLTVVPDDIVLAIADAAHPGAIPLALGEEAVELASVTFEDDAFELPWGVTAKSGAAVRFALLDQPAEASAVPGNMRAVSGDALLPIAGALSFELLVTQGATELALQNSAEVRLAWPAAAAALDPAAQKLYRFDARKGAFVEAGSLRVDPDAAGYVIATIDALGHWLIGTTVEATWCARFEVLQGGAPLAHGNAQLTSATRLSAVRVELDEAGVACAAMPTPGSARLAALARIGTGLSSAAGDIVTSPGPLACSADCQLATVVAQPIEIACVRATIAETPFAVLATLTSEQGMREEALESGQEICLEARAGTALTVTLAGAPCGEAGIPIESQGMACGGDGCMDLGTITCCSDQEYCGTTSDDDCDGVVDEGCVCGGTSCATSVGSCCAAETCGERSALTDECISYGSEPFLPSTECPSAQVPAAAGDSQTVSGCCLESGVCGLMWDSRFVCIRPVDVPRVWGDSVPVPTMSCTF